MSDFFTVYLSLMSLFGKVVVTVLFLLSVGFAVLFFMYFQMNDSLQNLGSSSAWQADQVTTAIKTTDSGVVAELQKELNILQATTSALLARVAELEATKPVSSVSNSGASQLFQKQIVHIGSASTTQTDWTNTGVEVTLNSADYPSGVNATFEAGLSIVGGEAWARLVNKTTGAIMTITEVSAASSTTVWKSSPHFKLFAGTNMYEVQVKSSSSEVANISSARIILTK